MKKVSAVNVTKSLENHLIKNYVTVEYLEEWWIGFVLYKNDFNWRSHNKFPSTLGPSRSFTYPEKQDILRVLYSDVLSEADVSTHNGHTMWLKVVKKGLQQFCRTDCKVKYVCICKHFFVFYQKYKYSYKYFDNSNVKIGS